MLALPYEIWRDAPRFEGKYLVSSMGNVLRIGFLCPQNWGKRKQIRPFLSTRGYLTIRLNHHGKKSFLLHRLLALVFIPVISGKNFINHKDGNKLNNSLSNLERCTESENIIHAREVLGKHIGYNNIPIVGTNIKTGECRYFKSLSATEKFGFKAPMISGCINGKRLTHGGYTRSKYT